MKLLLTNKSFVFLAFAFAFMQCVFYSISTVIGEIGKPYFFTAYHASLFGLLLIVVGTLGSLVVGAFLLYTDKHTRIMTSCCTVGVLAMSLLLPSYETHSVVLVAIMCSLIGFCFIGIIPIVFELSIEITFPVGEALSGGFLMWAAQTTAIFFMPVCSAILDHAHSVTMTRLCLAVISASGFVGLVCTCFVK